MVRVRLAGAEPHCGATVSAMTEPARVLHIGHRVADGVEQWTAAVRFGDASQTVEPVASLSQAVARAAVNGCDSLHFSVGVLADMVAASASPQT